MEFRRKRPVMIAMGLLRCAAPASLPVAFALGVLGFAYLLPRVGGPRRGRHRLPRLMLGDLGFAPWQYGLAFGVPCVGGLIGAWAAPRLVTRWDRRTVLLGAGTARACWLVGLAAVGPGAAGLVLVIAVEFAMITCMGAFNPVLAAVRLELTPADRVARVLTAWSVTGRAVTAAVTALWGLLAAVTDPRTALAAAGVVLLATPLLLPRTLQGASSPHEHRGR